jgi:hypothetical protein
MSLDSPAFLRASLVVRLDSIDDDDVVVVQGREVEEEKKKKKKGTRIVTWDEMQVSRDWGKE